MFISFIRYGILAEMSFVSFYVILLNTGIFVIL
jgi:hypothetical protein